MSPLHADHARRSRTGFTLTELIVVVAIIAVLIGLLVPILGGVRTGARAATTQSQMQNILTASAQYVADNQRLPGVFSQDDMGDPQNETNGFTNMENALLDLAGGVIDDPQADASTFLQVGPFNIPDRNVTVDIGRIGSDDGPGYLTLDDADLARQDGGVDTREPQQVASEANIAMPDIVDAFGYPLLMWTRNEFAGSTPLFARRNSSNRTEPAQYYWASNAGFLESENLGVRRDANTRRNSTLSSFRSDDDQLARSIAGLIGDPASPVFEASPAAPARAKGPIVLHSAGTDGFYGETNNNTFAQIVYNPTSGGVNDTVTERDGLAEQINDIVIGGGS
ncbi:MAG: type II secretion system protein [Planctomycetota bacterium]